MQRSAPIEKRHANSGGPRAGVARLLLIERCSFTREGLVALLAAERDFAVVEAIATTEEPFKTLSPPDIALVGAPMHSPQTLASVMAWRKCWPGLRILLFGLQSDQVWIERALSAGAVGFVSSLDPPQELFKAIRAARLHDRVLSPSVRLGADAKNAFAPSLTRREREVLQLVGAGQSNRQIAQTLGVSIKTVGRHKENLKDKLDLPYGAMLTTHAARFLIWEETHEPNNSAKNG